MIINGALLRNLKTELLGSRRKKRWAYRDVLYPETIWSDGVPYEFDPDLPPIAVTSLKYAMKFWEVNTCVTFRPRVNETQYIFFTGENRGCFSSVGRDTSQPEQPVNIGKGCYHFGVTTHEVGHALGLFHHQQRYDRDNYVTFSKKDVPKSYWLNFVKIPQKYLATYGLPYDVGSIMHYTPTEFASNAYLPGLLTADANLQGTMGSLDGPSFLDVQIVNRHYQCYSGFTFVAGVRKSCIEFLEICNETEIKPNCLNGGYPDPHNCTICKCPTGFGGDFCQLIESSGAMNCGGLIPTSPKLTRMRIRLTATGPGRRKCVYHIRAPPNRRVMIGLQSVSGVCQEGCYTSAVEMKMNGDFRPVGYRFCCESHSFRRMLSRGRNVPVTFFARDSPLESRILVVLTPDAEDATYLNATEMAEVYKQSDNDNGKIHFLILDFVNLGPCEISGLDMQVLQLPFDQELSDRHAHYANKGGKIGPRSKPSNDQSDYIGEYGSNGESYEDFSVYN
ncbi:astacin [Ancylostoma caninum]|uniref:Metalloendopeptidase n=1 Tax=Ancylostoma caninum TaxID=29170 RepID=A0A368GV64_ANCCA|nr:astacin [Ancylostoma caninum]